MADRLVGKTLGNFLLEEAVGKGRAGRVYRATWLPFGRTVAVKVLEEGALVPDELKRRFVQEAELLSKLKHPHIMPVYGWGHQERFLYLAMRRVQGRTLEEEMRAGVNLRYLVQVAEGLACVHGQGFVHQDVKPANVLVEEGSAILTDFGLAAREGAPEKSVLGPSVGTPAYFSPEQAQGKPATFRSDLYALGIILYEWLVGRHPFGPIDEGMTGRISKGAFAPPSGVSEPVAAILRRALDPDPARRYPSGDSFAADLRKVSTK